MISLKKLLIVTMVLSAFSIKSAEPQDLGVFDQKATHCIYLKNSILQLAQTNTAQANQEIIALVVQFSQVFDELKHNKNVIQPFILEVLIKANSNIKQISDQILANMIRGPALDVNFSMMSLGQ